jgi:tetratricopeptide (TPR) repeat protein
MCRMMAKEPEDRYPTCALFVEELRHAVERAPSARTAPPTEPTRHAVAAVPVAEPPEPPARPRRLEPTHAAADEPAPVAAPSRGRRSWLPLAAAGLVGLAIALFALLGGGDDGDQRQARDEPARTTAKKQRTTEEPAQTAPAAPSAEDGEPEAPAETEPPDNEPEEGPGPAAGSESPEQLNDRGYARLQAGNAQGAIPLLERSVKGFDAQGGGANSTTFGYALFNLGEAYAAVGRYDEAIPMYERRLQVSPNDRPGIVRARLREARAQAGQG